LGFLFAAWYLWLSRYVRPEMLGSATALVVAGCALRAWAAGYLLKGKRVAVGGPYAYVRNPLYCGSFVIGLGFCLALYREPLPPALFIFWLFFLVGFVVVYIGKSRAEETELARNLGSEYVAYRGKVPALFPVFGHVRGLGEQSFSRELYRRNREYQCLLGSAAVLAFLFWRARHGF
jgi:protein-S-isoprenylcysteine O-methyltransferase Ste14